MSAKNLIRKLGTINYGANETKSFKLPRNFAYEYLFLSLVLDISIITAAATAYTEGAFRLIQRLEIVADGRTTIKSIEGAALSQLNHILSGVINSASAVPTAVANNQAMNSVLMIDFAMQRGAKPMDSMLNAYDYSTLELQVTFGDESDMYSANSANVTINSGVLSIHASESKVKAGFLLNKIFTIEREVTSTSSEFQIHVSSGAQAYRGFLIRAEVDGNPSNSVINALTIQNGTDVFVKADMDVLQFMGKMEHEIEAWPTGYVFIDFTTDGYLTEVLDTVGMTDLVVSFDVTKQAGVNKIHIFPIEVVKLTSVA